MNETFMIQEQKYRSDRRSDGCNIENAYIGSEKGIDFEYGKLLNRQKIPLS